jgi:hypothetical protein
MGDGQLMVEGLQSVEHTMQLVLGYTVQPMMLVVEVDVALLTETDY